jgi:hypothetical protein
MHVNFLPLISARWLLIPTLLTLLLRSPLTLWGAQLVPEQTPVHYGVSVPIGPAQEPCEDEQSTPNAVVLSNQDDWEEAIEDAAPGTTLLLRGGDYRASDSIRIAAGAPGQPITLKPYRCEAVSLFASLRPRSHNIIAGLHLETKGIAKGDWVIRVDGKNLGHIEDVTIRYNTILGGVIDAIRILDDTRRITIYGNTIDGGSNGHNIFVTAENQVLLPDEIEISQNRLSKRYYDSPAEDMFQVRDVAKVSFTHNTCTDGLNMEECVDIKTTTEPIVIQYNLFVGDRLQQIGQGEDGASGCLVIHESDGVADNHLIEYNYFRNCRGSSLRLATGQLGHTSRATIRWNLITHPTQEDKISIWQAQDVEFNHNTVINGQLRLGDSGKMRQPINTVIKNNIFYRTQIEDRTAPPTSTYSCSHNLLFETTGSGFVNSPCSGTVVADPLFVMPSAENYQLRPETPANSRGEDGLPLGAFGIGTPPSLTYLPLVVNAR